MGSLFQAGLEVSVAAPGPVPDLTAGLGRHTGSRFEVREPSSVLVRSPPAFAHGILPLHCNQLQLQPLTPPGRLFCFFIQCLCASVSFLSSLFFFFTFIFLSSVAPASSSTPVPLSPPDSEYHFLHPSLCRLLSTSHSGSA